MIDRYFPAVDWSDPAWGNFESGYGSIEFNIGTDEPNSGFMMHVRASKEVVAAIVAMCLSERCQALDCSDGSFLEKSPRPDAGLKKWTAYRDQIRSNR